MELTLNREHLNCYDVLLDTALSHEETMEMIVPDACPDILRIVDTCAAVCLKSKEAQEGRVELSGAVRCSVLYLPDAEAGPRHLEASIPFSCGVDGAGIVPGCAVVAVPRVRSADTRVINPRKVLLRVDLIIDIRAYSSVDMLLCTGAEEDTLVEQLREKHNAYTTICVQDKPFTFSDDLSIPGSRPEAVELLDHTTKLVCSESKIIGSKLIFKGEASLALLYRAADDTICPFDLTLPFSQIMEIGGAAEEADCTVDVILTDCSCTLAQGEGRLVSVSLELLAQAVVREERQVELLADLYSVSADVSAQFQAYTVSRLLARDIRRQPVRDIVEAQPSVRSAIGAHVELGVVKQSREGTRFTLSADAAVTALFLTEEGEVSAVSKQMTIPCQLELPEGCECSFTCRPVGEIFATPAGGGVEVRFEVEFQYMALSTHRFSAVSGAQLSDAPAEESAPHASIVLRSVGKERLWDVAKTYRTTIPDILQANELESEDGICGKVLLIPRKR